MRNELGASDVLGKLNYEITGRNCFSFTRTNVGIDLLEVKLYSVQPLKKYQ